MKTLISYSKSVHRLGRVLAAIAMALWLSTAARAEENVVLSDSIRPLPLEATSRAALTPDETATVMEFMLPLKMRDVAGLQARVAKGEIVSRAEMIEKYFPLEQDYQIISRWLIQHGFKITRHDPNRLGITARGTTQRIATEMNVSFAKVTANGKTFISAASAPSLPASVAAPIVGITGLQPHLQKQVHSRVAVKKPLINNTAPFYPSEILKAYGASNLTVSGAGQTIAIVIDTPPKISDLTQFWTTTGVTQSLNNITFVQVVQGQNPSLSGEESLDTEWSSSIAPNAKVRVYVTTDLSDPNLDAAYMKIIADLPNVAGLNQVSLSYGGNELDTTNAQMNTDAQLFATLASAGVTVFASSGDNGSKPDPFRMPQISSPSNDPNVTAVGGTRLFLTSAGNVASETVWSGSGGGVSTYFSRPAWQTGSGVPAGSFRLNPDVSAPADPNTGALVIQNGSQQTVGGTSWSAPVWAGFCALINEARAKASQPPVGVLGAKVYPLIGTANFRDITSGNNGDYSAGAGYDLCTGIGTPNLANLIASLSGASSGGINAPTITGFTPASGPVGTTITITGTNFVGPLTVKFNGVVAQGIFTATQATYQVPAGATSGPISITTPNGTGSSNPFTVTSGDVSALPNLLPILLTGWSDKIIVATTIGTTLDARLTPADTLYMSFSAANIGAVAVTSAIAVEVDVDSVARKTVQLTNPFPANSTQSVYNINVGSLALGTHRISINIDPSNSLTEATKGDNIYVKTITILPPLPNATIVATAGTASAATATPAQITVSLNTAQEIAVVVNFTESGTAIDGADFTSLGTNVIIPAGQTSTTIPVNARYSSFATAPSRLIVTLATGSDYVVGTPSNASVTIQNVPPPLAAVSQPFAAPNPAIAGQSIQFNAAYSTATGETILYTWDFKDGTTQQGASVKHTYTQQGTYDVVVSVQDGLLAANAHVSVTVSAIPMTITSTALKFSFKNPRDSLLINGSLPMGAGYDPSGDSVTVTIGGYQGVFPLNSHGMSKGTGQSFALRGRSQFGVFTDSTLKFQLRLTNQDLFNALNPNPGFSTTVNNPHVVLPILFEFTSTAFTASPTLSYVTNGRTGSAK